MNALRAWRKAERLSIEKASSQLGISSASLSRIERGEQWPDRSLLGRIVELTRGEITPNDIANLSPRQTTEATGDAA